MALALIIHGVAPGTRVGMLTFVTVVLVVWIFLLKTVFSSVFVAGVSFLFNYLFTTFRED